MKTNTKNHKVVMLPTEKAINTGNNIFWYYPNSQVLYKDGFQQHLYITSDDEIKEGEYGLNTHHKCLTIGGGGNIYDFKIVATTDLELTNCSVCGMSNGDHKMSCKTPSLRTNIPAIPISFVEAYIKAYNEGKPITEVDLEMDGDESPAWSGMWKYWPKTRADNTVIVRESSKFSYDNTVEIVNFVRSWSDTKSTDQEILEAWKKKSGKT